VGNEQRPHEGVGGCGRNIDAVGGSVLRRRRSLRRMHLHLLSGIRYCDKRST
jgi:hypothetical protein